MVKIKKVSFDTVKQEIKRMFLGSILQEWNLLPDDIHRLAESAGIKLKWNQIEWWDLFESGKKDYTNDEFFHTLFNEIKQPEEGHVFIITDECFIIDKMAYCISSMDLKEFSSVTYPEIHKMDFFQPSDLILLYPESELLTILHHEGYVMQYRKNPTN